MNNKKYHFIRKYTKNDYNNFIFDNFDILILNSEDLKEYIEEANEKYILIYGDEKNTNNENIGICVWGLYENYVFFVSSIYLKETKHKIATFRIARKELKKLKENNNFNYLYTFSIDTDYNINFHNFLNFKRSENITKKIAGIKHHLWFYK